MFATLAYFSYFLFTKTARGEAAEGLKRTRNWWYRAFAIIIVISILLIPAVNSVPKDSALHNIQPAFWLESIALWAFGFAWAMKGEARWLLPDVD
jgi:hypothetical protein